jgi:hypothetical protein
LQVRRSNEGMTTGSPKRFSSSVCKKQKYNDTSKEGASIAWSKELVQPRWSPLWPDRSIP